MNRRCGSATRPSSSEAPFLSVMGIRKVLSKTDPWMAPIVGFT